MANLKLKFVHSVRDRHGNTRHYFRRPGFKSVRLPGLPGSAEFTAAYQASLAGGAAARIEIGVSHSKPGSVAAAVALYYQSVSFGSLGPATQQVRWRILDRFRDDWGGTLWLRWNESARRSWFRIKEPTRTRQSISSTPCAR